MLRPHGAVRFPAADRNSDSIYAAVLRIMPPVNVPGLFSHCRSMVPLGFVSMMPGDPSERHCFPPLPGIPALLPAACRTDRLLLSGLLQRPPGMQARNARICAKFYRWPCGIGAKTVPAAYSHNIPIENLRLSIAIFVSLWYNIRRRSGDSFRSPLRGHPTNRAPIAL